jgi:hypothetical protein
MVALPLDVTADATCIACQVLLGQAYVAKIASQQQGIKVELGVWFTICLMTKKAAVLFIPARAWWT